MECVNLLQAGGSWILDWALPRLAAKVAALDQLASQGPDVDRRG